MFLGGQISNDEYTSKNSKNVNFDCNMKAFFDERKNVRNCNVNSFSWLESVSVLKERLMSFLYNISYTARNYTPIGM